MFNHILCATDLSPRSDEALRVAVHMAARYNSNLTVLNVHEEFMDKDEMIMLRVSVEQMQEKFREIALAAKEQMQELVTAVGVDDLSVEYKLHEGKPGEVIISSAHEISHLAGGTKAILIVMGTNGRDSLVEMLLGSVAEYIVRHSPFPVLVVPQKMD
jgi:nucleotide-binding universal stress UspA family protein